MTAIERRDITGLVLAGGKGSRMAGRDKGLETFAGRPLIAHALDRLAPQVGPIIVSANRNSAEYAAFGHEVIADRYADFRGPLAGLHAGLVVCATPYLACVPCDAPAFPDDLVRRLAEAVAVAKTEAAFAATALRIHPTFLMVHVSLRALLQDELDAGRYKVAAWCRNIGAMEVRFDNESMFANLNHPTDLDKLQG